MLTHLSLFSGIGGIDLAAEWAGFDTIAFCEIDEYCRKVLRKHWPCVPIIEDVKDVTKERIAEIMADTDQQRPILCTSGRCGKQPRHRQRLFEGGSVTEGQITLISGGFPCQPHSVAGKRKGAADERNLWPEFRRVIGEIRPRWVLGENVPGIFSSDSGRFFGEVATDLAEMGYSVGWCTYGAVDVGALHRRNRVFIVGYSQHAGWDATKVRVMPLERSNSRQKKQEQTGELEGSGDQQGSMGKFSSEKLQSLADCPKQGLERTTGTKLQGSMCGLAPSSQDVADTDRQGLQGHRGLRECGGQWTAWQGGEPLEGIWESEPPVGRVASRISSRVDRLKCLGNAVVPQQVYPILKAIADIENSK